MIEARDRRRLSVCRRNHSIFLGLGVLRGQASTESLECRVHDIRRHHSGHLRMHVILLPDSETRSQSGHRTIPRVRCPDPAAARSACVQSATALPHTATRHTEFRPQTTYRIWNLHRGGTAHRTVHARPTLPSLTGGMYGCANRSDVQGDDEVWRGTPGEQPTEI